MQHGQYHSRADCGESESGEARRLVALSERRSWEHPGRGGLHHLVANVASIQQAWTFKLPAAEVPTGPSFGSLTGTPIVANGVAYLQDLGDNVYALALATGKLKWEYQVSSKIVEAGPNGVALARGVVYGDTNQHAPDRLHGHPHRPDSHCPQGPVQGQARSGAASCGDTNSHQAAWQVHCQAAGNPSTQGGPQREFPPPVSPYGGSSDTTSGSAAQVNAVPSCTGCGNDNHGRGHRAKICTP
jgi:PQQ enzyme repeat